MAFNYFANDAIKQIEKDNIPENFIKYYEEASDSRKAEIEELRPDLVQVIRGEVDAQEDSDEVEVYAVNNNEDVEEIAVYDPVEEIVEDDIDEDDVEASTIIDAWEDISISSWQNGSVKATVLVCKFIPNNTKKCGIHRIPLKDMQISYDVEGSHPGYFSTFGVRGAYCPECMDFFLEEDKAWVVESLDKKGIPVWMQTVEQTMQEWRENGDPIELEDDAVIYIPSSWKEKDMVCPIHTSVSLVEDFYVKKYKDRRVDFQACYCSDCKKIIMRNVKAQQLEEDCGEIGIPPIEFRKLKPEHKMIKAKAVVKIQPKYVVQNGMISQYDFEEDVDWEDISEDDTIVVSFSRTCPEEDHETEDKMMLINVQEKSGSSSKYLTLVGYCDECEKYYIDQDDYKIIYEKGRPIVMVQDDTNSDYYITSGSVFDSEKKHLDDLEESLSSKIHVIESDPNFISRYAVSDVGYDDGGLADKKAQAEPLRKEIEKLASYMPNPYAHRADFAHDDNTRVYYLGPDDIVLDGQTLVISYNSEFGQELVNYQTIEMTIGGIKHKAKRRRDFDITKGKLFGYTEQSDEDVIFRSGITDPYLVKVLNARKKQHQLLDIVATAQQNQREIINLPFGENIIVQGCAGSGKTMVLLQRMSSLKYRNKDFNFDNAIILTPNDNFNLHISGLASSLQLGYVERKSIEGYYLSLLERYDESFKLRNKIIDEMNVPQEYVDYIYSEEFWSLFLSSYDQKIREIKENYARVAALSEGLGRTPRTFEGRLDCDLVQPLISEINLIANDAASKEETVTKAREVLANIEGRERYLREKMSEYEQMLQERIDAETAAIYEKLKVMLDKHNETIGKYNERIEERQAAYESTNSAIFITRKAQKLRDITESIENAKDHIKVHQEEIGKIEELMQRSIKDMNLDEKMAFFRELTVVEPTILSNISTIERNIKNLEDQKHELEVELPARIEAAKQDIIERQQEVYSDEIMSVIRSLKAAIVAQSPKEFFSDIYQNATLKADTILKAEHGKSYVEKIKGTHRFDLFIQLKFAMRFFNKNLGTSTLICVDEGQDLTLSEYRLIHDINPGDSVFNIYGDVNQLLKYNRGISNWSLVADSIAGVTMHVLNENYRNTNQITQFCNDSFDMNVSLTGADGHKVKEIIRSRLESALADLKISEERVAVILPRKVNKNSYIDKDQLPSSVRDILGSEMGNGKIAVVYVDEVKGVEFDRVFVVSNSMTKNEKYIAYTRALSDLTVVVDTSLDEIVVDKDTTDAATEDKQEKQSEAPISISKNVKVGKVQKKKDRATEMLISSIKQKIKIVKGSIIDISDVDAIVCPTDSTCSGRGYVEGLVHEKAGQKLMQELNDDSVLELGAVRVTKGYGLNIPYIIHVNRPKFEGEESDFVLRKCYENILTIANSMQMKKIAIPPISTGSYGYPEKRAGLIALETVFQYLHGKNQNVELVVFVSAGVKSLDAYKLIYPRLGKKSDDILYFGKCKKCEKKLTMTKDEFDYLMSEDRVVSNYCSECGNSIFETRTCSLCGKLFDIDYAELDEFEQMGRLIPDRCEECRNMPDAESENTALNEKNAEEPTGNQEDNNSTSVAGDFVINVPEEVKNEENDESNSEQDAMALEKQNDSVIDPKPVEKSQRKIIISQSLRCSYVNNFSRCVNPRCERYEKKCRRDGCHDYVRHDAKLHAEIMRKYENENGFEYIKEDGYNCSRISFSALIKDQDLSVRIRSGLQHAGIDTVRELCNCTLEDIEHIHLLQPSYRYVSQITDWLTENNLRLRLDEDGYLYLYPGNVKDIIKEKKFYWEYRLFIETFILNQKWISNYQKQEIQFWKYEDEVNRIDSFEKLCTFCIDRMNQLDDLAKQINDYISDDFNNEFEEENEEKIISSVERIFSAYKKIIILRQNLRYTDATPNYKKLIERIYELIKGFDSIFDDYIDKLEKNKILIGQYDAGTISVEMLDVGLDFQMTNSKEYDKCVETLREELHALVGESRCIVDSDEIAIDFKGVIALSEENRIGISLKVNNQSSQDILVRIKSLRIENRDISDNITMGLVDFDTEDCLEETVEYDDFNGTKNLEFQIDILSEDLNVLLKSGFVKCRVDFDNETCTFFGVD